MPTMQAVRQAEPVEMATPAPEGRKVFKIIQRDVTKKNQKQLYARELAVPVDSKLVQAYVLSNCFSNFWLILGKL